MRRRFNPAVVLAAVCVSLAVVTVNVSFLNVGLPSLSKALNASNTGLEWIVDGYALVFAGFLLVAGSLGDRIGQKRTLVIGLAIFATSSLLAAMSHSTDQLIAARCAMGAGAACVMPMTLSILTGIYAEEEGLRRAIGVWAAVAAGTGVAAPVTAGLLLTHFWWGSLFVANIPFAVLTMLAVLLVVPSSPARHTVPFDFIGGVLSILFSAGLVTTFIEAPDRGWLSPFVLGGLVASAALLVGFVMWERRVAAPLVDVRFFRQPRFSVGCLVVAMTYFFSFGSSFAVTQYLQLVLSYSPLKAGIALMPSAAVVMLLAPFGARAFGRWGARPMIPISILIMSTSAIGLASLGVKSSYAPVLLTLICLSGGVGLMAAGTTSMVMSSVPAQQSGMASGTQSATRQLGGALGVAIVGSILAANYSATLRHSLAGTPAAPYTSTAVRSLSGALTLPHAPGSVQAMIAGLARLAFTNAIHVVAVVIGVFGVIAATAIFIVLSRSQTPEHPRRSEGEPGTQPQRVPGLPSSANIGADEIGDSA